MAKNVADGFTLPLDGWLNASTLLKNRILNNNLAGTCAIVRVQIDQEAVLTRTAFTATLTISNTDANTLTNVTMVITIRRQGLSGDFTSVFVIPPATVSGGLTGILGANNSGSNTTTSANLPGGSSGTPSKGTASWMIYPTVNASGSDDVYYEVGGQLSYYQGTQLQVIDVFPATIRVVPEPLLNVTYFWERDVYR